MRFLFSRFKKSSAKQFAIFSPGTRLYNGQMGKQEDNGAHLGSTPHWLKVQDYLFLAKNVVNLVSLLSSVNL